MEIERISGAGGLLIKAIKVVSPSSVERAENAQALVEAISGAHQGKVEKQRLIDRIKADSERLGRQLDKLYSNRPQLIPEYEKNAAQQSVIDLVAAQRIDKAEVVRSELDPEKLLEKLAPSLESALTARLVSSPGKAYAYDYLRLVCHALVTLVRDLPDFQTSLALEHYLESRRLSSLVDSLIQQINSIEDGAGTVEGEHRRRLVYNYSNTDLFGFSVPAEYRRQPVDIAYVTLSSSSPTVMNQGTFSSVYHAAEGTRVDELSGTKVGIVRVDGKSDMPASIYRQDYQLKSKFDELTHQLIGKKSGYRTRNTRGMRLLLTGGAGSGKTTVCHWLSTRAPLASTNSENDAYTGLVPFYIQARRTLRNRHNAGAGAPGTGDLLASSGVRVSDVSVRWVEDTLERGKALILVDGLDELSEIDRQQTQSWLTELTTRYSGSHFMVTSRPDGVDYDFYGRHDFVHSSLLPMTLPEVHDCIHNWFRAMEDILTRAGRDWEFSRKRLIDGLGVEGPLRQLASTPLLTAMLCAFYAYNPDQDPRDQSDLYDKVTAALVDGRDRVRDAIDIDLRSLRQEEKRYLLSAVAQYMTTEGLTTIFLTEKDKQYFGDSEDDSFLCFADIVKRSLPFLANLRFSSDEVTTYLVQRAVVIEQVVGGEVQFAHRSFQEFFASMYLPPDAPQYLIELARSSAWRKVAVFASPRLEYAGASALLQGLLELGRANWRDRRRFFLLAAECMSRMVAVDPVVSESVRECLKEILPPTSVSEAEDVAILGDAVLPWLRCDQSVDVQTLEACVRAAAAVGSRGALDTLSFLARHQMARGSVAEFSAHWARFDAKEYAEQVLAHLVDARDPIQASTSATLAALRRIPRVHNLLLSSPPMANDFAFLAENAELRQLEVPDSRSIRSLSGLSALPLHRLSLSKANSLVDARSASSKLWELYLRGASSLSSTTWLKGLTALRVLVLEKCGRLGDGTPIGELEHLLTLSLRGSSIASWGFLSLLENLRTLYADPQQWSELGDFENLPSIRNLDLTLPPMDSNSARVQIPTATTSLTLAGRIFVDGLAALPAGLRKFRVSGSLASENLQFLAGCESLETLDVSGQDICSLKGIESNRSIRELVLVDASVKDLEPLRGLPRLNKIKIVNAQQLVSVEALLQCPTLSEVAIIGGAPHVDGSHVEKLDWRVVAFEPFDTTVGHGSG